MHGPSAGKNRAVGQGDGKSVEMDSAVIDQRAKGAVPRQRPGAALLDGKSKVAGNRRAALGVFIDIQGAGNIASALFGGIPATGAIARTAANIAC